MVTCKKDKNVRDVMAWEMSVNPQTNPEGLPKEVFAEQIRRQRMTDTLKSEYIKEKITLPKYGTKNDYTKPGYETLRANFN